METTKKEWNKVKETEQDFWPHEPQHKGQIYMKDKSSIKDKSIRVDDEKVVDIKVADCG